jgi:hypothetical protein
MVYTLHTTGVDGQAWLGFGPLVHRVIAAKQEVTDRDDVVEEAGGQKEQDNTSQRGDDQPMM